MISTRGAQWHDPNWFIGSLTCVAGVRLTQRTQIILTPWRFIKISDSLTSTLIIESKHEDSSVTKISKSLVTLYSYKAILRYNCNNASVRLISRLLELHASTDWICWLWRSLQVSLFLCRFLSGAVTVKSVKESLECILVVELFGLIFTNWLC